MYKIYMSKAFVFLNCDLGTEVYNISQVRQIAGVQVANGVSGIYDIVAEISAESHSGLTGIVKKFRLIDGIRSCLTMIVAEGRNHDASRTVSK
jgi:hypothetical protein